MRQKRNFYLILPAIVGAMMFTSCNKEEGIKTTEKAMLTITFDDPNSCSVVSTNGDAGTKAAGAEYEAEANYKTVKTLEIFAFNEDGSLDAYQLYDGGGTPLDIQASTNSSIVVATGVKDIYVVANSHKTSELGTVKSLSELMAKTSNLKSENVNDFTMVGSELNRTISGNVTIPMELNRLISRVILKKVKTAFTGGFAGMELTDVSAYLINVNTNSSFGATDAVGSSIICDSQYVPSDNSGFTIGNEVIHSGMNNISTTWNETKHFYYCYANNSSDKKTMFVIEGKLNGTTYYYPIAISNNPEAEDYLLGNNLSFEINDLVISRAGSNRPDVEVDKGTISFTLTIKDWVTYNSSINI